MTDIKISAEIAASCAKHDEAFVATAFAFLDEVRESSETNMMAAGNLLLAEYADDGLTRGAARELAMVWMRTLALDVPAAERVRAIYARIEDRG